VRLWVGLLACAVAAGAEEVTETFEDGSVKARYAVDEEGRRHGTSTEFHPGGRTRARCAYAHGVLHGAYASFHENGRAFVTARYRQGKLDGAYAERDERGAVRIRAAYAGGLLHGKYEAFDGKELLSRQRWQEGRAVEVDGIEPFPRSRDAIRRELEALLAAGARAPADRLAADRDAALRRLKAYRFLVGVPHGDLILDDGLDALAQAAAEVCSANGGLSHTPPNPGWPEDRFAAAARGAINCNLSQQGSAADSVDSFMNDSDERNIAKLGHRNWCVNPAMLRTGFGAVPGFSAMWATDASRPQAPAFETLAFPPPGHVPLDFFGTSWAWSLWLDPADFPAPSRDRVLVEIVPVAADFLPSGPALELDHLAVLTESAGIRYSVVFRPGRIALEDGARYRVTVSGLGPKRPLRYFVEFFAR
jgi:hypothetical protein